MQITWMGTASILLEASGERILFDPFVQIKGGENPNGLEDFLAEETIFITHGHFDHLSTVPWLLEEGDSTVFCSARPARTLEKFVEEFSPESGRILEMRPGDEFSIGGVSVKVLRGKHIKFDKRLIFKTLRPIRLLKYWYNLPSLFLMNKTFKEANETLAFDIRAEGKEILLLGSLALSEEEDYPKRADLLILPYQGNSDLEKEALKIIKRLKPKRILLSHFDNAFPPLSRSVDTRELKQMMDEDYPDIPVVKPKAGKAVHI